MRCNQPVGAIIMARVFCVAASPIVVAAMISSWPSIQRSIQHVTFQHISGETDRECASDLLKRSVALSPQTCRRSARG